MRVWRILFLGLLTIGSGCDAPQPASLKTVAAYEVPLLSESDRTEFLDLVRAVASPEGLHVDSTGADELKRTAETIPESKRALHAAVWRGPGDDQNEAVIVDGIDHLGLVWITFARGQDAALAQRFRDQVMSKILARWPETLSLPVMPTGSIPLHGQLRKTPSGYKLDPAYVSSYAVDASSPLVDQP